MLIFLITLLGYIRISTAITAAAFKSLCLAQSPNVYLEDKCYTLTPSTEYYENAITYCATGGPPNLGVGRLGILPTHRLVDLIIAAVPAGNYWVALHQNDTIAEPDGNWYWEDTVNGEQYGPLSTRDEGGLPWGPSGRVEPNDGICWPCFVREHHGSLFTDDKAFNDNSITIKKLQAVCEYTHDRSPRDVNRAAKVFRRKISNRLANAAVQIERLSQPAVFQCVERCIEIIICASVSYNRLTKECVLQKVIWNDDRYDSITNPHLTENGWNWYELQ